MSTTRDLYLGDVTWVQSRSSQLIGSANEEAGASIALAASNTIMVMGCPGYGGGLDGGVRRYTWSGSDWTHDAGALLAGPANSDNFGFAVALTSDGNTLVVGAYFSDVFAGNAGYVYVYDWGGSTWSLRNSIAGPASSDRFGKNVRISDDGNVLFCGGDGRYFEGKIHVYDRNGATWDFRGALTLPSDLGIGLTTTQYMGDQFDINADGTVIYATASTESGTSADLHALVKYSWDGAAWVVDHAKLFSLAEQTNYAIFSGLGQMSLNPSGTQLAFAGIAGGGAGAQGVQNIFVLDVSNDTQWDFVDAIAPSDSSDHLPCVRWLSDDEIIFSESGIVDEAVLPTINQYGTIKYMQLVPLATTVTYTAYGCVQTETSKLSTASAYTRQTDNWLVGQWYDPTLFAGDNDDAIRSFKLSDDGLTLATQQSANRIIYVFKRATRNDNWALYQKINEEGTYPDLGELYTGIGMSGDGLVIAGVDEEYGIADGGTKNYGAVIIYRWNIVTEQYEDATGYLQWTGNPATVTAFESVACNSDGSVVTVAAWGDTGYGLPELFRYEWNESTFQYEQAMVNSFVCTYPAGWSLLKEAYHCDSSGDGSVVTVTAYAGGALSDYVTTVYEWGGSTYTRKGSVIGFWNFGQYTRAMGLSVVDTDGDEIWFNIVNGPSSQGAVVKVTWSGSAWVVDTTSVLGWYYDPYTWYQWTGVAVTPDKEVLCVGHWCDDEDSFFDPEHFNKAGIATYTLAGEGDGPLCFRKTCGSEEVVILDTYCLDDYILPPPTPPDPADTLPRPPIVANEPWDRNDPNITCEAYQDYWVFSGFSPATSLNDNPEYQAWLLENYYGVEWSAPCV